MCSMDSQDNFKCEHCGNELHIGRTYRDRWCGRTCYEIAKHEYEGSEDDLARQSGENNFPTIPTPDPNPEL